MGEAVRVLIGWLGYGYSAVVIAVFVGLDAFLRYSSASMSVSCLHASSKGYNMGRGVNNMLAKSFVDL